MNVKPRNEAVIVNQKHLFYDKRFHHSIKT